MYYSIHPHLSPYPPKSLTLNLLVATYAQDHIRLPIILLKQPANRQDRGLLGFLDLLVSSHSLELARFPPVLVEVADSIFKPASKEESIDGLTMSGAGRGNTKRKGRGGGGGGGGGWLFMLQ